MKIEELRIGLWVYLFGDAVQLTADKMIYLLARNSTPEPITLTEEWLIRFQWTLHKSDMYWMSPFSKDLTITRYATTEPIFYFVHENYQVGLPDIKLEFVHQLQNLYFCLTGQELTLAPPQR